MPMLASGAVRRLLNLQRDDDRSMALLDKARVALENIAREDLWAPVQEHRNATDPLSDDALRDILFRTGKAALNAMLDHNAQGDPS